MTILTLQPDGTDGLDDRLSSGAPNTNLATNVKIGAGESNAAADISRTLIKFDLSSIPAGSTINSAILSLYATDDLSDNDRTIRVYRMIQSWTEAGATWNKYDGTNNWPGGAGGFGAADCEQTDIGSRAFVAAETLFQFKDFTLTASAIQEMITGGSFTNNGFMVRADTETDDGFLFASSDNATAANRPKLVIDYTAPSGDLSISLRRQGVVIG